jgi:putative ABC transport system permease protein
MEIPIRQGRSFSEQDHAEAQPVAIVNDRLANSYWPGRDVLGRAITIRPGTDREFTVSVVGVAADSGRQVMGEPPQPEIYLPYSQGLTNPEMVLVARSFGDPALAVPALRGVVRNLDAQVPIIEVSTVPEIIERWLLDDRILAGFLTGIGMLALLLASVGLYGVMSYTVAQRTHEIGVRAALGADSPRIFKMVLKRCLALSSLGVAAGLLLSVPVGFLMATQLYGVGGADPLAYALVVLLLTAVGLMAGYIPARRATRVNPVDALRWQ